MTPEPFDEAAPRDWELKELADEVGYEFLMAELAFRELLRIDAVARSRGDGRLFDGGPAPTEVDVRNAWLEVMLVHLRNVTDFLAPSRHGPIKDDVCATHYVSDWTADDGGPALQALVDQRRWINKRLQHVTATRVRVSTDVGARLLADLHAEFASVVKAFLDTLSPAKRAWFTRRYRVDR